MEFEPYEIIKKMIFFPLKSNFHCYKHDEQGIFIVTSTSAIAFIVTSTSAIAFIVTSASTVPLIEGKRGAGM
jgi:hypothetical protein